MASSTSEPAPRTSRREPAWRRKLRKLRALTPAERRRFFMVLALLPVFAAGLRLLGHSRWHGWLRRSAAGSSPTGLGEAEALAEARAWGESVRHAAAYAPGALCLERSLTLWWLLARRGIETRLRAGVRREPGCLEAHAWVECRGRVVGDAEDVPARFTAFDGPLLPTDDRGLDNHSRDE